jgi:hypothetical protein
VPIRRSLAALLFLTAPAATALAQGYTRSATDTLHYHEVSRSQTTLSAPQGEVQVASNQESIIGVLLLPGDSAVAWYDSLSLSAETPMGTVSPDTKEALRLPYHMSFDARGRVTTREAPKMPESLQGLSDLRYQFNDFFPRLPASPLRRGLAWTDTVSRTDSTGERALRTRTIGNFRVERDTLVNGEPALVIAARQDFTMESSGPVPNQPATATVSLTGADTGVYVFSAAKGRYLGRARTGALKGDVKMSGPGGASMTMGQAMKYENRVEVVK